MKISELKDLSSDELLNKMEGLKRQLLDFRMLAAGGKLDKPHQMRLFRRDVAKIMTVLNTRQERLVVRHPMAAATRQGKE